METYDAAAKIWMAGITVVIVVLFLFTYWGIKKQEAKDKKETGDKVETSS